jgi:hypothetical protein
MRAMSPYLLFIVFLSLLAMQAIGLHLHVNSEGLGGLHGSHIHEAAPDAHKHDKDSDVSLIEIGIVWGKFFTFLIPFVIVLLAAATCGRYLWIPDAGPRHMRRRSRWRPPLRAPPSYRG